MRQLFNWFYEEYNPEGVNKPEDPTRQVERKRRKSRFEVLVQFLVPAGVIAWMFYHLYLGLPVHTWLIMGSSFLLYVLISFVVYPVEHPDRYNLPNTLLGHPFRLAKTEHGIQRILTLLLTPGWLLSNPIVRFFTLVQYATVSGKQADQLYYSTNLSVDKWWVLPGLALIGLSYSPIGKLGVPSVGNDVGFILVYMAGFLIIFGVRARNAFMEVCHKIIATVWAAPPAIMLAGTITSMMLMTPSIFLLPGDQSVFDVLYDLSSVLPLVIIFASVTFATWSLTRHLVYEKYNREIGESDAHVITIALLYFIGGTLGLHRFYTGKMLTGVLYAGTMALLGIGLIYDGILIVFGSFDK